MKHKTLPLGVGGEQRSKTNTQKLVSKTHLPCTLVNHIKSLPSYYSAGIGQIQSQLQRETERWAKVSHEL